MSGDVRTTNHIDAAIGPRKHHSVQVTAFSLRFRQGCQQLSKLIGSTVRACFALAAQLPGPVPQRGRQSQAPPVGTG